MLRVHPFAHQTLSALSCCIASCCLGLVGCGGDGPQTVPVSGTVTFAGGAPPAAGTLNFAPLEVEEGLPRRPGRADFDTTGAFEVSSFGTNDGLVPGRYRVRIECWKVPPVDGKPGETFVPADFQPADLEVKSDSGRITYDVPIP